MKAANVDAARRVAVVVAARDAATSVGRAVASALGEPEVAEVVVVDDASSDGTEAAATAADDGSGRLAVHRLAQNAGPAAARNRAIAASGAPLVAVLDADDVFVPGRLARLLAVPDWDLVADDVLFVRSPEAADRAALAPPEPASDGVDVIDLETFLLGGLRRRGREGRELGYLHVLARRDFLDRHAIRYDETLRLGEDVDLYARSLAAGARFRLLRRAGYVAVRRPGSLSARHRTEDLGAMRAALGRLTAHKGLTAAERHALTLLVRDVAARHELRRFLDEKRRDGLLAATLAALGRPLAPRAVLAGVLKDKLREFARRLPGAPGRTDAPQGLIEEVRQR